MAKAQPDRRPELRKRVIAPSLEPQLLKSGATKIPIIINLRESKADPGATRLAAKKAVKDYLAALPSKPQVNETDFYLFTSLTADEIKDLAEKQRVNVFQIWPDEKTFAHVLTSSVTVKATACWRTFSALGKGITWAVLDTGIASDHPHFKNESTIDTALSQNFSTEPDIEDHNGHGTHVAGIIAGIAPPKANNEKYKAAVKSTDGDEDDEVEIVDLDGCPSGMAPLTKLVNLKVLDRTGAGSASATIRALEYIRKTNDGSRSLRIVGANISLGHPFDVRTYGCGHSPLCEEITRAVRTGVVVVVSCGNSGYGTARLLGGQEVQISLGQSIDDPANAELAISVGSTHKSAPYTFGVSYFSSKGPTADGRMKPDLVAPGERVISCSLIGDAKNEYEERSGTSMAAPHVSGAIAAFMSVHNEFIGQPEKVKEVFKKTASSLDRDPSFQGAGLIDLMRALTSV